MGAYIFNILSVLRAAKDVLVSAGPTTAYAIAEAAERVADGARQVGRFIEQYGPLIQFSPGGGSPPALDADSQQWVGELEKLNREVGTALQVEGVGQSPRAASPGGQRSKTDLLQEISDLTAKMLDAVGRGEPPAQQRQARPVQARPAQKHDTSAPPGPQG